MRLQKNRTDIFTAVLSAVFLTAFDQWTKYLAVKNLKNSLPVVLWKDILELRYLENHGAAFGILQQQQWLFFILTLSAVGILCFLFLFRIPRGKSYLLLNIISVIMLAGAFGNLIDRLRQSYVVDFIYFRLIDFPIFNIADCYVSVSAFLLAILLIFPGRNIDWSKIL